MTYHPTGLTARGDPFEHDTANGAFNSLVSVNDDDDDTLALVYGGDLPSVIANTDHSKHHQDTCGFRS